MTRIRRLCTSLSVGTLALAVVTAATAQPPKAQPVPSRHAADARFAAAEHDYVVFFLQCFPVVATYLGGAAFDPQLADIDGKLRNYSTEALAKEDARLAEFRARFGALAPVPVQVTL